MIQQLDVPIFGDNILFLVETTKEEWGNFVDNPTNKDKLTDDEIQNVIDDIANVVGVGGTTTILDKGGHLVYIRDANRLFYSMHEIYHVADRILKSRGIVHDEDDEIYAYMVGWLSEEYDNMIKGIER